MTDKPMTKAAAERIAGTMGFAGKMPGTTYGIPAKACHTGGKLAQIPGTVCADCYALKGNYIYPSVEKSQETRLASIDSPHWENAMVMLLNWHMAKGVNRKGEKIDTKHHRWHDSGDIQSEAHLDKICNVARRTPKVNHWLPIKELKMLLSYVAKGNTIPGNLVIRVSGTNVDGPATKQWKHTSVVYTETSPKGAHRCVAPDHDGHCGPCRACWSHDVAQTAYLKH